MSNLVVKVIEMPQAQYSRKCPYALTPNGIVIHNTATDASATSEISYMQGNTINTSFHFAVDENQAVQGVPLNRNSWHAGDGTKTTSANRTKLSIEICRSKSGGVKFTTAEENTAILCAKLMQEYGWKTTVCITKHQDYKATACPHRTLELGWQRFLNLVAEKYAIETGAESGGKEIMQMSTKPVKMQLGPMSGGDLDTMRKLLDGLKIAYTEDGGHIKTADVSTGDQNTVLQKVVALGLGFEPLAVTVANGVPQADFDAMRTRAETAEAKRDDYGQRLATIKKAVL
ncbi:MAG: N-acetylmuramoyl-L-alanine amidase family protein [Oscillospiraceae bacterium]